MATGKKQNRHSILLVAKVFWRCGLAVKMAFTFLYKFCFLLQPVFALGNLLLPMLPPVKHTGQHPPIIKPIVQKQVNY